MPIISITIENFKGIAEPVEIPIRPITLLFGKNSAGKSTILQALHYLREVLENRRPDPDRTQVGGDIIDLGGFHSLVHRHELDRRIRIQVAFSLDDDGIPNNGITSRSGGTEELQSLSIDLNGLVKLAAAWVEVITAWEEGEDAYIAEYAVGLNGDELVRLRQSYGLHPELVSVNFRHTLFRELDRSYAETMEDTSTYSKLMWSLYEDHEGPDAPVAFLEAVPMNEQESIYWMPFVGNTRFASPIFGRH